MGEDENGKPITRNTERYTPGSIEKNLFGPLNTLRQKIGSAINNLNSNSDIGEYQPTIAQQFGGPQEAEAASPQRTLSPTPQPQPQQGGFRLSVPGDNGDVRLPDTLAQGIGNEFEDIQQATSSGRILNHPYGRQKKGYGTGENAGFITGEGWDDYNYDEKTGEVKWVKNPFTKESEKNEDRGLFRINNETFYTYLQDRRPGYRDAMYRAGIIDSPNYEDITPEKAKEYYKRMYDPDLNTKMARIIYDKQGWDAWFAAPEDLVKTLID